MSDIAWDTSYRQEERFTTRIRTVLESYAYGWGIFQEWLANADDAGAQRFSLVLDTTRYNEKSSICPQWQGPSLLIFNNSVFRKQDWGNFTKKVGDSAKKNEKGVIGKFGLGALTMYHFTDVIQIVSDTEVLFLDVHEKYLLKQKPSLKGNFLDLKLLEKYPDQFAPFVKHADLFGCTMKESFQGTLFRIPLRTKTTAAESEIKNQPAEVEEVENLMREFGRNLSDMLIFLRRIEEIQIMKIDGKDKKLLFKSSIQNCTPILKQQRLLQPPDHLIKTLDQEDLSCTSFKLKTAVEDFTQGNANAVQSTWLVSLGLTTNNDFTGVATKLLEGNLKFPKIEGKPFCFLPIISDSIGIPIHIHGSFQMMDNRRNLWVDSKDTAAKVKSNWNIALLKKISLLWANMIEELASEVMDIEAMKLYALWPVQSINYPWDKLAPPTLKALATKKVIHCIPLPGLEHCHKHHWITPKEALFNVTQPKGVRSEDVNTVMGILQALGYHPLQVPFPNFNALRSEESLDLLEPKQVRKLLKKVDMRNLPPEINIDLEAVLKYLISDSNCTDLHDISLIPLLDGGVGTFKSQGSNDKYFLLPKKNFDDSLKALMRSASHRIVADTPSIRKLKGYNIQEITTDDLLEYGNFSSENRSEWIPHLHTLIEASWLKIDHQPKWHQLQFIEIKNRLFSIDQLNSRTDLFIADIPASAFTQVSSLLSNHFSNFTPCHITSIYPSIVQSFLKKQLCLNFEKDFAKLLELESGAVQAMLKTSKLDFIQFRSFLQENLPGHACLKLMLISQFPLLENVDGEFVCYNPLATYHVCPSPAWEKIIRNSGISAPQILKLDFYSKLIKSGQVYERTTDFLEHFAIPFLKNLSGDIYTDTFIQIVQDASPFYNKDVFSHLKQLPFIKNDSEVYSLYQFRDPQCRISRILFPSDPELPAKCLTLSFAQHLKSLGFESVDQPGFWIQCASALKQPHLSDEEKITLSQQLFQILVQNISRWQLNPSQIERIQAIPLLQVALPPADKPHLSLNVFRIEKKFACFNEVAPMELADLCWTVMYILHPSYSEIDLKTIRRALRLPELSVGVVVSHVRNLTKLFEQWSAPGLYIADFDNILMRNLAFLSKKMNDINSMNEINKLHEVPFVRTGKKLFPPHHFCLWLEEDMEDYFKLPSDYLPFKELLVKLGAEDVPEVIAKSMPVLPENPVKFPGALPTSFNNPALFTDITFMVENQPVHAHRLVLSLQCEVFKQQFTGGFVESNPFQVIQKQEDVSYEAFKHFLKFFYTGALPDIHHPQILLDLIKLSEHYMVPYVKIWCERQMISKNILAADLVCDVLEYAIAYKTEHLRNYCVDFIKTAINVVARMDGFKNLSTVAIALLMDEIPQQMEQAQQRIERTKQKVQKVPTTTHKPPQQEKTPKGHDLRPTESPQLSSYPPVHPKGAQPQSSTSSNSWVTVTKHGAQTVRQKSTQQQPSSTNNNNNHNNNNQQTQSNHNAKKKKGYVLMSNSARPYYRQ